MSRLGQIRFGSAPQMRDGARRAVRGLGWVAAAVLISVSGAGLVVAIDHPATGSGRPELTARGDAAFALAVPDVRDAIERAGSAADGLARAGREAASALRDRDAVTARARIAEGDETLVSATEAAADLLTARDALLTRVGDARLGTAVREQLVTIQAALEAASRLPDAWSGVASGAGATSRLTVPLVAHDRRVLQAVREAREARYAEALTRLAEAGAVLDVAEELRDDLPAGLDHPTLDESIARSAAYSAALVVLYTILVDSGGEVTDEAAAALAEVDEAQAALPADSGAWVVIVTEIAEPRLTEGLIGIERARGILDEGIAALD